MVEMWHTLTDTYPLELTMNKLCIIFDIVAKTKKNADQIIRTRIKAKNLKKKQNKSNGNAAI